MNEQQLAKIVNLTSQLLQEKDVYTKQNIVSDKTIYAKEGLFVCDFNPAYDFFIKGRGCITGDLVIKGNLFYENNGSGIEQSFMDVTLKPNKPSGFRIRDDTHSKGLMWDHKEDEFILSDDKYFESRSISNLLNLKIRNVNFMNAYCKNILIDSSIISTHSNNNINVEGNIILKGNLKLDGIIQAVDVLNIKSQVITKTLKVDGSLFVENGIETTKNITCNKLTSINLETDEITAVNLNLLGDLKVEKTCEINGFFHAKKAGEFSQGLEVKGNLYIGKNLIFTDKDGGIAFSKLSHIENASVSYINGKKISNQGDILTTNENQEMSNKSLGTTLNAKFNKIINIDNPSDHYDVANKKYVDQFVIGSHLLEPVRLGTTEKLDAVFMASNYQLISKKMESLIIDGIETKIGDRILVKNQQITTENGIYIVISKGHKNQQWILQLADDCIDILKNRPRITPLVLVKFGEKNVRCLFGINFLNQSVWEFLNSEEFINYNIIEKMEQFNRKMEHLEKQIL